MLKKRFKAFIALTIVMGLLFTGLSINLAPVQASGKNSELTKLKVNLETYGMLYLTDDSVASQKTINFNQEDITTKLTGLKGQNICQLDSNKFRNIVVDVAQLSNKDVLSKIRESFNSGAKIVLRKNNIKISEAYSLLGESEDPKYLEQADSANDKLTTVAISMFKDSTGAINASKLNVEINNENEVTRLIIIALRDDHDTLGLFKNHNEEAYIQTIKPVYANLSTSWPYVKPWSNYDQWATVNVNYSCNVYKNPNNPTGGYYISMQETGVTVTPRSGYYSSYAYIYHSSASNGQVHYYSPQAQTNVTSDNTTGFGATPTSTLSFNLGTRTNIVLSSGGPGYSYSQWMFYPVNAFGQPVPTQYQTYYEPTDQYYQSGSYFSQGFSYSIQMFTQVVPGVYVYNATASHSGMYVSGY